MPMCVIECTAPPRAHAAPGSACDSDDRRDKTPTEHAPGSAPTARQDMPSTIDPTCMALTRFRNGFYLAMGLVAAPTRQKSFSHASEALGHADRIAVRIIELDGEPDFDPHRPSIAATVAYSSAS